MHGSQTDSCQALGEPSDNGEDLYNTSGDAAAGQAIEEDVDSEEDSETEDETAISDGFHRNLVSLRPVKMGEQIARRTKAKELGKEDDFAGANHKTIFKGKALDLYMKYAKEGFIKVSIPPPVTGKKS